MGVSTVQFLVLIFSLCLLSVSWNVERWEGSIAVMGSPIGWDNRVMFERYLYDYFRKNNMHETADIFRDEVDLTIDPTTPPVIDVPDGFLHEWWLILYDMFRAWHPNNPEHNESSSYMVEKGDPSPLEHYELNAQMIRELTVSTDFGFTIECNLTPVTRCPLTGTEQVSHCLMSSQPQHKSATLTQEVFSPPGNLSDIVAQGMGSLVHAMPGMEKPVPNKEADLIILPELENYVANSSWEMEECPKKVLDMSVSLESERNGKNSVYSEDGNNGVPSLSETSSPIPKSMGDIIRLSSSPADDYKCKEITQSCISQTHNITSNTDASEDRMYVFRI